MILMFVLMSALLPSTEILSALNVLRCALMIQKDTSRLLWVRRGIVVLIAQMDSTETILLMLA